ncbi:MAG: hypothetical protein ACRDZY_04220, partial [Acidimicrobiales bacterium]
FKVDLPKLISAAEAIRGAPSSLKPDLTRAVADLKKANSDTQTKLTQAQLSSKKAPPAAIQTPLKDYVSAIKPVQSYASTHCGP